MLQDWVQSKDSGYWFWKAKKGNAHMQECERAFILKWKIAFCSLPLYYIDTLWLNKSKIRIELSSKIF